MITRAKNEIFKPKALAAQLCLLSELNVAEPTNVASAISNPKWNCAMQEELSALSKNNTWVLVEAPPDALVVDNRWVFRVKYKPDGSVNRFKARLVAKGFQQTQGLDYFETFSPVIKQPTVRVMLTLAVTHGWDVQQIDVNNAFLNGDLHETVFMHQPPRFVDQSKPTHVCRLIKALYGLKQTPRAWYDKLHSYLIKWGFKNTRSDTSRFHYDNGSVCLFLLVYVDDILITGNNNSEIKRVSVILTLNLP